MKLKSKFALLLNKRLVHHVTQASWHTNSGRPTRKAL
jgi:hypothetical protein